MSDIELSKENLLVALKGMAFEVDGRNAAINWLALKCANICKARKMSPCRWIDGQLSSDKCNVEFCQSMWREAAYELAYKTAAEKESKAQ